MGEEAKVAAVATAAGWDWIWKVVVWGAPLLFTAGGAWWRLGEVQGDLARIEARVEVLAGDIRAHELAPGHYDSQARLGTLERTLDALQAEQKRTSENLAAICQVTGARCR